jgi:cyclopropane fatty-acyl-phospholipid synthase-like methyltransferase
MDGTDSSIFPHLPYIFQDVWELGASPETVIDLIKKYFNNYHHLRVLDLGCGKGAVSVKTAKAFHCSCHGIDAVQDFINEANAKAKEFSVDHLCRFEVGDIRSKISALTGYDVIVLDAIGNVFGNCFSTLKKLSGCLKPGGKIIIDDAYIKDESENHPDDFESRISILKQVNDAGMKLIDEVISGKDEISKSEGFIFANLKKRCEELILKYPEQRKLFRDYINKQSEEGEILKSKVICSTMLFGK